MSPGSSPGRAGLRPFWPLPDWLVASALFLVTFVSRIPFRTTMLYAWDSVLYTRALDHFDVTIGQPQPPGHIFYVGFVWLVNHFIKDPNSAMVWVSAFFSAAAVAVLFWLGRKMFDRTTGIVAALLLATSLSFWLYSEVAYPYTLLAFLSIGLAAVMFSAWEGRRSFDLLAALLLGVASGFRQDLLPFMLPLLVLVLWRKPISRIVAAAVLLAAGILSWYVPSALLSGGFSAYREASSSQSDYLINYSSVLGRGFSALKDNLDAFGRFTFWALSGSLVLIILFFAGLGWRSFRRRILDRRFLFLAVWSLPSILFYIFVHVGEFGYVFSFLPAALLAVAWTVTALPPALDKINNQALMKRTVFIIAGVAVLINLISFLVLTPDMSANRLAARDDILRSRIDTIRANFDPRYTLIVSVFDAQEAQYYLPAFSHFNFDPSVDLKPRVNLPNGVRQVVIFEEYLKPAEGNSYQAIPLVDEQTLIYLSPRQGQDKLNIDWDRREVTLESG